MKEILRIGICDDNREDLALIQDAVQHGVKKIGIWDCVNCTLFHDGESLYEAGQKEHFDLYLLDIEMPGLNGFQLAKRISAGRATPCLIFVSVHESFVFSSQAFMPLWFVRKSMLQKDMLDALHKYYELTAYKRACCQLKGGSIYIRDIMYIECSGHLLTVQKADGKIIRQYGSLKSMEGELARYDFLRIHKSYLVNQRYIENLGKQEVRLTNGTILEMGRDRRKAIRRAMYMYEGENYGVK